MLSQNCRIAETRDPRDVCSSQFNDLKAIATFSAKIAETRLMLLLTPHKDTPRMQVHDRGKTHPSLTRPHVVDVAQPFLVWPPNDR